MIAPKTNPGPAARSRATFSAAAFDNLRAAAGEGQGEPLRIALNDIDEDVDQPRTVFDADALASMAESIRAHGVVQPVVVRPPVNGRYLLVFGARRLRAARLADVADIPAIVRAANSGDFAAQLIENQQRAGLGNRELAAAIARLSDEGATNRQIAAICALKDYQVAAFRQAGNFPAELAQRMDHADMRALYDLYRQWGKTPAEVLAALPDFDTFISVTEARRIVGSITGKATGSVVLDRTMPPRPIDSDGGLERTAPRPTESAATHARNCAARQNPCAPVFMVAIDHGENGRLVVHQRAQRPGYAVVAYAHGVEEVDATALRIVRIE